MPTVFTPLCTDQTYTKREQKILEILAAILSLDFLEAVFKIKGW